MADTKALFTQRFDAARTALSQGDEPAAAEYLHSAIVAARSDPNLRRELASALFHLGKLSRKFGRAGDAEAETLLTEALDVSEAIFGSEHAALAPVLNELGRLHVHRSQYARAEETLNRLLAITRSKGEDNADVATALAALAVVKRKLGDDATAEDLFRDALRIREKVLEPSHMVTVVTLEHLSDTCAARGNYAEALALLRRGLATREVALGPGHASVQTARSRVTELELKAAVAADTAAAAAIKSAKDAVPAPVLPLVSAKDSVTAPVVPLVSAKDSVPAPVLPLVKRVPDSRTSTPRVAAVVAAASLMASSIRTPSASQIVISPVGGVAGRESGVPQREGALADVALSDVAIDNATLGDQRSTIAPAEADGPKPARNKRSVLYLSAGVAAVVIALAGLLMLRPRAGRGSGPATTTMSAQERSTAFGVPAVPAGATESGSTSNRAAATVVTTGATSLPPSRSTPAPTAPAAKPEQQTPPDSAASRLPRVNVHLAPINIPSISDRIIPAAPIIDSNANSATERQRTSDTDRTGTAGKVALSTSVDVENAITPARIIGHPPAPRFPDALLRSGRHDGQVVVRFLVNERGNVDVASMIVEQSDDDLFTAAVRDILPRYRFEPARTHAPESKPIASWVSVPFRFTTTK